MRRCESSEKWSGFSPIEPACVMAKPSSSIAPSTARSASVLDGYPPRCSRVKSVVAISGECVQRVERNEQVGSEDFVEICGKVTTKQTSLGESWQAACNKNGGPLGRRKSEIRIRKSEMPNRALRQ